jgi:hypothetical protein
MDMPERVTNTKSVARIGAIALAIFGLLVCVFVATTGATEPDKTPPTVSLSGTAVKAVEEGKATGSYQLHVAATDGSRSVPQSGVAKIEVAVDGYGQQSWEKYCPEGSCGLEENWAYVPSNYTSEGPRWITVKFTDHAGNATEEEISLEGIEEIPREAAPTGSDKTPPTITLAGSAEKAVWQGASTGKYELRMFATDGSPSAPQSGVAKIEVAVDGSTLQSWEKYCPVGSCRLMVTWPYSPGNSSGTHHHIVVTARDHAGNVATKKIEWDPTPPTVSASGELKTLENQYINGQGTKTVAISATDNHSGVRLLSLEDEGHGVLVSKTPTACVLKPLKDEECPLAASETLTADTTKMPEGANHLRVVAEDFAGNVTRGQAWTVYVDRTAPVFPSTSGETFHVYAFPTEQVESSEIFFATGEDPPLSDGAPGSGIELYSYRTSIGGGPYTEWKTSIDPYFTVVGVSPGTVISVQVRLRDRVANESGVYESAVTAPSLGPPLPGEYSPEEGVPGAPGGTCAAEPARSGCPPVEKIIVEPVGEGTSTPYGPSTSASRAGEASPQAIPPGDKCAVTAAYPNVTLFGDAHTEVVNECLTGVGVIYSELLATLYKYQEDGELQFRGSTPSGRRTGAGVSMVNRYSKCFGRDDFNWKAEAFVYTDIEGIGYIGGNKKYRSIPCN